MNLALFVRLAVAAPDGSTRLPAAPQPRHRMRRAGVVWLLAATLLALAGCEGAQPTSLAPRSSSERQPAVVELRRGLEFLERLDEFDQQQAIVQATYHLNRWLDAQTPAEDWSADPLIQTLPRAVREGDLLDELDRMQIQIEDVRSLLEAVWLRDLSDWVSRQPRPGPLAAAAQEQVAALDDYEAEQLLIADRLFDWTVRNIQLDELLEYPAEPISGPDVSGETAQQSRLPAPQRAVPGPGYQLAPWQVLLYGHGDAVARARLFALLARQRGIDVVMLAFPGRTTPPRPRPWLPAAVIGGQLYLFDAHLGLPIRGPDGQWVATLEQVRNDPGLLSALSVGDEYKYRASAEDLVEVLALIDASPQALSPRMKLLESSLTGEDRTVLSCSPSQLAAQLKESPGVDQVLLWALPFETIWYRTARQSLLAQDEESAAKDYLDHSVFQGRTPLARARYVHFRGEFDSQGERQGAKALYLQSRVPDAHLNQLETSLEVQRDFGLERIANEREIDWRRRLAVTKLIISNSKRHASYWLGLAHYDSGKYEPAIQWLQGRTLEATPDGPWTAGARYNLGRAYEAIGQAEQARELYLRDDSQQAHGNLLRARLLRQSMTAAAPAEATGG